MWGRQNAGVLWGKDENPASSGTLLIATASTSRNLWAVAKWKQYAWASSGFIPQPNTGLRVGQGVRVAQAK